MDSPTSRKKHMLCVDDDASFRQVAREVFTDLARGGWEVSTAENHAEALNLLGRRPADVVVLDVNMPVMDGVQFLQLLQRAHPGLPVVMLTGNPKPEIRARCLEAGAALFLEKLLDPQGFAEAFAAIDALARAPAAAGFQGLMQRVGLQEVLQLQCLGARSCILEVFAGRLRGRIYIRDGAIIHADLGGLRGEMALYSALALRGGGFNLTPFAEPPERTIAGQWEFLLMEGARLADEGSLPEPPEAAAPGPAAPESPPSTDREVPAPRPDWENIRVEEILLCSGGGEALHFWGPVQVEPRRALLRGIEEQARRLRHLAPIGGFDYLEIVEGNSRCICQTRMDRQVFVRSSGDRPSNRVRPRVEELALCLQGLAGLAGWSLRSPGQTAQTTCLEEGIQADQVAALAAETGQACEWLRARGFQPDWVCWVHEGARVYAMIDQAGAFLCLICRRAAPDVTALFG
jgi:CheY-like chemotaxis protein